MVVSDQYLRVNAGRCRARHATFDYYSIKMNIYGYANRKMLSGAALFVKFKIPFAGKH